MVQLEASDGHLLYENVANVPRWLRGEFHGPDGRIDGHLFPSDPTTFVVRVPVIAGARLHLKGGSANVDAGFDLATLADNVHLPPVDLADVALVNSLPPAGNPANRVDLLIMEMATPLHSRPSSQPTQAMWPTAFSTSALTLNTRTTSTYKPYSCPRPVSGADHPPYDPDCIAGDTSCCGDSQMQDDPLAGTFVNTAFDAAFCTYNIHRLLTVDTYAVFMAAAAVPDWDEILVIVNDTTYDLLAEGLKLAPPKLGRGSEKYAIHCKGVAITSYEPRGSMQDGVELATCPVGSLHGGRGSPERIAYDSLTLCTFLRPSVNRVFGFENYVHQMLRATYDWEVSEEEWKNIIRRMSYMERCYSIREGYRPERDDLLPERFYTETIYNKYGEPKSMDRNVFMEWRNKLYLSYELDSNGLPPKDLLKKLGMEFVIPTLEKAAKS